MLCRSEEASKLLGPASEKLYEDAFVKLCTRPRGVVPMDATTFTYDVLGLYPEMVSSVLDWVCSILVISNARVLAAPLSRNSSQLGCLLPSTRKAKDLLSLKSLWCVSIHALCFALLEPARLHDSYDLLASCK